MSFFLPRRACTRTDRTSPVGPCCFYLMLGRKSQPLLLVLDDLFTNSGRRRLDLAVDIELSSHTTAHERCLL